MFDDDDDVMTTTTTMMITSLESQNGSMSRISSIKLTHDKLIWSDNRGIPLFEGVTI
jgi:hypothetical protein